MRAMKLSATGTLVLLALGLLAVPAVADELADDGEVTGYFDDNGDETVDDDTDVFDDAEDAEEVDEADDDEPLVLDEEEVEEVTATDDTQVLARTGGELTLLLLGAGALLALGAVLLIAARRRRATGNVS